MLHDCFAQCTPGLERLLAGEIQALGVRPGRRERGGVAFRAGNRQLYAANVWLRTANRVLVRAGSFGARTWGALETGAAALAWQDWLGDGVVPAFRVSSSRSTLYHTAAVAERLARVLGVPPPSPAQDRAGNAGAGHDERGVTGDSEDGRGPEQLVVVRIVDDRVTISVDSSGLPLHRRGWRQAVGRAPLRETLAAAVVLASGWDASSPLVDPFCGSGTLVIEAARLARGLPPGGERRFAFQDWPSFEPGSWASVRGVVAASARPLPAGAVLVGADRDAGAIAAAAGNAERAGVEGDVEWRRASLSDLVAPDHGPGRLVANPPYGGRARGGRDLRDLYARLGDVARLHLPDWEVTLLVADLALAGHTRLPLVPALRTSNGGIPVTVMGGRVPGLAPCPDGEAEATARRSDGG